MHSQRKEIKADHGPERPALGAFDLPPPRGPPPLRKQRARSGKGRFAGGPDPGPVSLYTPHTTASRCVPCGQENDGQTGPCT